MRPVHGLSVEIVHDDQQFELINGLIKALAIGKFTEGIGFG